MKKTEYIFLILIALATTNCRTTVPERDSVAPTFLFHIRGNTLNEEIRQTFDFDSSVLYLKREEVYNVLFSGNDAGGLQFLRWRHAKYPIFRVNSIFSEPCLIRDISPIEQEILCNGDRNNPLTGLFTSIDFVPIGNTSNTIEEIDVYFDVGDYRGNITSKILTIRITNEAPRIGPR